MDLPNLLNKLKNTPEETRKFVAIEVGSDSVKSAIWQSNGQHTEVVSIGSIQSWTSGNDADLLAAIDASLGDAQATIEVEPDQVIFGLPESWATGDAIAETKKGLLKEVCRKLGFKPLGFVVTTEAMNHYLRNIEGGPPSVIFVRFSATDIACSLVFLGSHVSTQIVERSAYVAQDVEEGIARIPHNGHLPSRIILFSDQEDTEAIRQDMLAYDWQKRLEFLHIPQIELFPKDWTIRAIAIAGGGEVVESLGLVKKETQKENAQDDTEKNSTLGFTTVVLDESEPELEPVIEMNEVEPDLAEPTVEEYVDPVTTIKPVEKKSRSLLMGFRSILFAPGRIIVPIIIIFLLISVFGGGFFAYRKLPQATITVNVGLNPFEQELHFKIDPNLSSSVLEAMTIPGKKASIEKSGSKSLPTTGTRTVGDRAKGKVTIYNRTTSPKTLPAGTTIKSSNLKFTLDTTTTVASASTKENADFSITTEPSKIDASATAVDIGDQYNIGKDTQLSISNFPQESLLAVATSTFAGGSSRKVQAVSKDDIAALKKDLISELQSQMSADTLQDNNEGLRHLPVGEPNLSKESYSAKAGEEANEVSLDLTLSQTIYEYNINEVTLLAQQTALQSLPENVQIKPDSTKIQITKSLLDVNDIATVSANVVIQYIPRIDSSDLAKNLVNAPVKDLSSRIQGMPNYLSHSVESKWLFLGYMPLSPESIDVRINPVAR